MRQALFLLFVLFITVLGRRGSTPAETPKKRGVMQKWGPTFGWGLGVKSMEGEPAKMKHADETQEVQEVTRGTVS